uniref:ZP-domain containing protein Ig-like domain-containing protein n=1 Tax=Periophthalmus magnuspinnatus TaxID=409849 RepID=A0A3B4B7P1_9GOBI
SQLRRQDRTLALLVNRIFWNPSFERAVQKTGSFHSLVYLVWFVCLAGVTLTCHERYLMISVDQFFTGENLHFEAVDENGAHAITKEHAARCGYSVRFMHLNNKVQLRASYLSCHTECKVTPFYSTHRVTHALNKTCSPSLPWSLREVTCEVNYMEVSVKSEITCPSSPEKNDWDNLKLAHSPSADWQVTFQRGGEQLPPASLKTARHSDYVFDLTHGRLMFRTPYGQPHSFIACNVPVVQLDGVPVEVVHATLFSRQSWLVLLIDLITAEYSTDEAVLDEGYMSWETPDVMYPGLHTTNLSFSLSADLMTPEEAEAKGFIAEKHNNTVGISVPYDAEGGYRKSVVSGDLFEFYTYDLYTEQLSVDEDGIETRLRTLRTMSTPLLTRALLDENRTVVEEQRFTLYLGDIPQDLKLVWVELNRQRFEVPLNSSSISVDEVVHPNDTHGLVLKVPFNNSPSFVFFQFTVENIEYKLDINYTLMVTPERELYHHRTSFMAVVPDLAPPQFKVSCSESSITFKLDHKPSSYKWAFTVDSEPLTVDLATRKGLVMVNDSRALQLDVPLLSHGYNYSLQGFLGTFEIQVRDQETYQVQSSTVKTCPFFTNELLVCSPAMWMIAVVDLTLAVASGGVPSQMTLRHQRCVPKEADGTRALFMFPVNDCSSFVKVKNINTAQNVFSGFDSKTQLQVCDDACLFSRVILQCTYPVSSLYRLFSTVTLESDTPGVGRIIHTSQMETGTNELTCRSNRCT